MTSARIARLLAPFLPAPLSDDQLAAVAVYLELLLRWNARMNLTAVRDPEQIVTRHFGESLFAAAHLLRLQTPAHCVDVGSGAGFPGLPLKIYDPRPQLTLIEAQQKKATFLREVIRVLRLGGAEVFAGRAEAFPRRAGLVTLRAVEQFDTVLPVAASLLEATTPAGAGSLPPEGLAEAGHGGPRLAMLIGDRQVGRARQLLPAFRWQDPVPIPESSARVLLVGSPA